VFYHEEASLRALIEVLRSLTQLTSGVAEALNTKEKNYTSADLLGLKCSAEHPVVM
jgi:hypothetical protein